MGARQRWQQQRTATWRPRPKGGALLLAQQLHLQAVPSSMLLNGLPWHANLPSRHDSRPRRRADAPSTSVASQPLTSPTRKHPEPWSRPTSTHLQVRRETRPKACSSPRKGRALPQSPPWRRCTATIEAQGALRGLPLRSTPWGSRHRGLAPSHVARTRDFVRRGFHIKEKFGHPFPRPP